MERKNKILINNEEASEDSSSSEEIEDKSTYNDVFTALSFHLFPVMNKSLLNLLCKLNLNERSVFLLNQDGVHEEELYFVLTEVELENNYEFSRQSLLRHRLAKQAHASSAAPIPSALFSIIPIFRGKTKRSIADPCTFMSKFISTMTSAGIDSTRWYKILLMSLNQPEDASYWNSRLQDLALMSWKDVHDEFMLHFDVYDQRTKYELQFQKLKQLTTENCQTYFDRAAELINNARLDFNSRLVITTVRNGIRDQKILDWLACREDLHDPYNFQTLRSFALMFEDRVGSSSLSSSSSSSTSSSTSSSSNVSSSSVKRSHSELSSSICAFCKHKGHVKGECRKFLRTKTDTIPNSGVSKTPRCYKCKGDHAYTVCPKNICSTCKTSGHLNFNCPMATCSVCKKKGHTDKSFSCPNKKGTAYMVDEEKEIYFDEINEYFYEKYSPNYFSTNIFLNSFVKKVTETNFSNSTIPAPITIEDVQVLAMIDTGSSVSIISREFAIKLGIEADLKEVTMVQLQSIFTELPQLTFKMTDSLRVLCGRHCVEHKFFCGPSYVDVLIGMDLFSSLGLGITGLPLTFNVDLNLPSTDDITEPDDQLSEGVFSKLHRIDNENLDFLLNFIENSLVENENIGEDEFCNHPAAELPIDLTDSDPIWCPQFDIPERLHDVIDMQIEEWLRNKKIEEASPLTHWNSSLLLAPKRDLYGTKLNWRTCFDARAINRRLKCESYGIPKIKQLFARVAGFKFCSALDLIGAFHQLPIRDQDKPITTFSWKNKRYQFRGAPFGLKHIPFHFQRLMTTVLSKHLKYILIYIDDIFIFSDTIADHANHVRDVLHTLTKANLRIRREKCHFGYTEASLLGHIIDGSSIRADPSKVTTFMNLDIPKTGKQLQALLGFIGYLRDYIPCFSKIAKPLERIKNLKFLGSSWGEMEQFAFDTLKRVLSSAPVLSTPDYSKEFFLATDSSQFGNGAVLFQQDTDGRIFYIGFYSKSLNSGQTNYPATKRELLAIMQALKYFRNYLYGRKFTIFTDHKALIYMMTAKVPNYMLANWFSELQDYDFDIIHRPGIEMVLPDSLSRLYLSIKERNSLSEGDKLVASISIRKKRRMIKVCPQCTHRPKRVSRNCSNQLCLDHCTGCSIHPSAVQLTEQIPIQQPILLDDVNPNIISSDFKNFVKNFAQKIDPGDDAKRLDEVTKAHLHNHFGAANLFKYLFSIGFYWHDMKRMCDDIASSCQQCLQHNVIRRGYHPLRSIHAELPWDHLAMDLGQVSQTSKAGANYFLVITDICTRFILVRALPNKASLTVSRILYLIFTDFGVPKILQSDNGSEFVNSIIDNLKKEAGFQQRTISAYYPQSNGTAESSVKLVKNLLKKYTKGDFSEWCTFLPAIQLALNSKISARHHSTPFSLMFTRPHNLLIDHSSAESNLLTHDELMQRNETLRRLLYPAVNASSSAASVITESDFNLSHRILEDGFPEGAFVMKQIDVRSSGLEPKYEGPFKVLKKTAHNTYVLLDSTGALYQKNVPPSKLKLISVPEIFLDDVEHFEVESIERHKGKANDRKYYVKWKGFPRSANTWVCASDFDSEKIIQDYWKKFQSNSKKKRTH